MSDLQTLAGANFKDEAWDKLFQEEPETAEALRYLLLLEKHGGRDADNKGKLPVDVTKAVAEDLGISVPTLIMKRRKWSKNDTLMKARDFLAPIRAEADMILADQVMNMWPEIVMGIANAAKSSDSIYAKIAGAQFLQANVIAPAKAKQLPTSNETDEYMERLKQLENQDDEAAQYLEGGG